MSVAESVTTVGVDDGPLGTGSNAFDITYMLPLPFCIKRSKLSDAEGGSHIRGGGSVTVG